MADSNTGSGTEATPNGEVNDQPSEGAGDAPSGAVGAVARLTPLKHTVRCKIVRGEVFKYSISAAESARFRILIKNRPRMT